MVYSTNITTVIVHVHDATDSSLVLPGGNRGYLNRLNSRAKSLIIAKMSSQSDPSITVYDTAEQRDVEAVLQISASNLSEDLQAIFHEIFDGIYEMNVLEDAAATESAYGVLLTRVEQEVTAHPVLASTVNDTMLNWSLLQTVCRTKLHYRQSHPAIKVLIQANPCALLWECDGDDGTLTLHTLAKNPFHCELMPWIAEHFAWVFDHESCRGNPPHIDLVEIHSNGKCHGWVVRKFYELYPQGLRQGKHVTRNGCDFLYSLLPLHKCLLGWKGGNLDLIRWMARQYPDSISFKTYWGRNALHCACTLVSEFHRNALAELCVFFSEERPDSVRVMCRGFGLPIHMIFLRKFIGSSAQQKVILHLLRAYPQSVDIPRIASAPIQTAPRSNPFVRSVFPLLEEEISLKEAMSFLADTSAAWCEATECSKDMLHVTVSHVFKQWATLREANMMQQTIPERIMEVSREFREYTDESDAESDQDHPWPSSSSSSSFSSSDDDASVMTG